jgi:membrane-associated protein
MNLPSILDLLRNALARYGYWAVGAALLLENAGIPVPGETVLLLASFMAYSERMLRLPWIILIATAAATLGDNVGFALGFYGGRPLLERYRAIFKIRDKTLDRGEELFARYGAVTVFFARFVFGLRVVAGPLAGVLRMPWRKFMIFNVLGAVLWVTVISAVGYLFGQHWEELTRSVKRIEASIAVLIFVLAVFLWWKSGRTSRSI